MLQQVLVKDEVKENCDSRDPALAGLHGKEGEHGIEAVVIVEVFPRPPSTPSVK